MTYQQHTEAASCAKCGATFSKYRADSRYCSARCRGAASSARYGRRHDRRATDNWRAYYYGPRGTITALLSNAHDRARRAGVPFSLPRGWVAGRLERGVCEVTGLPFERTPRGRSRCNPFAPSIDRIEPALGYAPANCRLVCFIFNQARSDFGDGVLLTMARALVERSA